MFQQKAKALFSPIFSNMLIANIIIAIALIIVVSLYLSQINTTTQLGLDMQSLERSLMQSREISRDLQLEIAEYQSITRLEDRIVDLSMTSVGDVAYVSVPVSVTAVAKR